MKKKQPFHAQEGHSLAELLLVVVIISVLSALIVPMVTRTKEHASIMIARQQQAQLQTALGSWVAAASAKPGGLASAKDTYNSTNNKLALLQNYLQPATYLNLTISGNTVSSEALTKAGASLEFTTWSLSAAPSILWK